MEVPGLALLAEKAPDDARRLEELVRRLVTNLDADRWAADQVRWLVEAHARGDVLGGLVSLIQAEAGTGEAWAVLWTGNPADGAVSFRALSGRGHAPPDPETLSRTLLAAVARRSRAVWLDDRGEGLSGAASIIGSDVQPHGAVPLGRAGAVYLAGTGEARAIPTRARQRIEALCRLAGGFVDAAPDKEIEPPAVPGMVGTSAPMQVLARTIQGFAAVPWPVLILGETGSGKELVARALHDQSARAGGPFVAVNCAAIPEELAEATLFGHERGAFTGADRKREGLIERANGGTLFLDEVGELSARVQAKLLRVLQEGRFERVGGDRELWFDGRIVAATLRPLRAGDAGFRADLFHRLGACVVRVPALRERREDIRVLATHLLARALAELPGAPSVSLTEAALTGLSARDWPGNVRELDNALKAAVARAVPLGVRILGTEHLEEGAPVPIDRPQGPNEPSNQPTAVPGRFQLVGPERVELLPTELSSAVESVQRAMISDALRNTRGNRPLAASRLGVSRQWLHTLLTRWAEHAPAK